MRILVLLHGWYGERIARNVAMRAPEWSVKTARLPTKLPAVVEDVEEEARKVLGQVDVTPDLVLFLSEEAAAAQLLPFIAERLEVGAVIAPVDDYRWLPRGLERQLSTELGELGVYAVFPRPFCTLAGGRHEAVRRFSSKFGAPKVRVVVSGGVIREVEVLRGAPCGSTHYMAERLRGAPVEDAPRLAGLYTQLYPCLASHARDPLTGEEMIHLSGLMAKRAVEEAITEAKRS